MPFFYSTDLKSQTIDPSSEIVNNKVQFRLPEDTAFYPNLRLANVGSIGNPAHTYNRIAGVYGCIKHVRLLSNGVELDAMRFANRYLAFKNLLNNNSENCSVNRKLVKHSIGFEVQPTNHTVFGGATTLENTNATAFDESKLGHLDLRKCLPVLENMPVIDTAVFKNCILEIELEKDVRRIVVVDNVAQTIQTPLLIAEEITNPQLRASLSKDFTGAVWNKIEHDVVNVAAVANPAGAGDKTDQSVALPLNSFDNKFLSRMVLMKTYNDKSKYVNSRGISANVVEGFGDLGSLVPHKEKIQVKLNGANIFPQPIESPNQKLMMINDSWGRLNVIPYGHLESVGADVDGAAQQNLQGAPPTLNANNKARNEVGGVGFFGCAVNATVGSLSVQFERTAVNNGLTAAADQNALDIHAYGECRKAIAINSDGSFNVSYA
tara:strand:+ start:31 stop:1335 length:1305 start_codon:yes stop_codon:yes gene_type:complete